MKMKFPQHIFSALVFIVLSEPSEAIRLNSNGGYDIVIAVEDNVIEPLNVLNFLNEIQTGIQRFSTELWKATHRRFFISSVDVLVPANWWTLSNFDTATWQTILGSEIRISHDVGAPNVVNPSTCGTSGLYVELPDNFFKIPRGGNFGPVGKALVNIWARYRYGVWEEHGIPGDTKFPYFYAHPSFEPKWEATGCSNEEIIGDFRDIDGELSDRCDPYNSESPDDNCRFIPSPSNTANSSLMHLHWLDSITEFCDSKTHNYAAPNRQNLFCGHRSVWEVIRESDDYKSTKTCMDSVPSPQFRVMKESRSPEFYILLDRGRTVTPEKVLKETYAALNAFVSIPSLERVNIAVGTYPHANANHGRNQNHYVKEEVGWAPMSSVIYDIERVLEELSHSGDSDPVVRDFGLAIQEVASKIKARQHMAGTVILVVKRGASPNLFDKITFEQEVIASIKEDSRIKVFAIEMQQGDKTPYTNLQTLAEATTGQYHLINDTANTAKKLEPILGTIQEKLEQSSIMNSLSSWTTQKQYTEPNFAVDIPIYDNVNVVKVHLTASRQMVASDIYLEQLSGEHATMQLTEKGEWDESADLTRRVVFTYTISNPTPGSLWSLRHGCHTEKLSECRFFLVVTAHNDRPTPRLNDFLFDSQSITIDVSTSAAEYYHVDMSAQGLKVVPFAIYAKIEMDQQRVLGLTNVTAFVRLGGEHNNHLGDWAIPLADDGTGLPDIARNDGIYSGIFTPLENGLYQISVAASGVSDPGGVSTFQDLRIVNHAGSLMQINQQSFGCKNSSKPRCISAVPRGSFSRVQDMQRTVAVENAGTFKPGKPTKILDFTVTTFPNFNVEFEFTSPRLLGSDEDPEEFRIYMAPHVDNFIGSTDLTKHLISERGQPAGSHVKIKFNAASKAIPFYAVEAVYRDQKGGPSNIVGAVPSEEGSIVPSPTTTSRTTSVPSSVSTSTTEFPWPTTTPTTESPFPTTTEESEETDYPTDPPFTTTLSPTTSTTLQPPISTTDGSEITATSSTTIPSTTTEEVSTTVTPSTTTEDSEVTSTTSSSTTLEPPTTTEDPGATGTTSSSTTLLPPTTTEDSEIPSSSTTTEVPSTTEDVPGSSTTLLPSTTEDSGATGTSTTLSTTLAPPTTTEDSEVTSSTTENIPSSSTTLLPSTTEDSGIPSSSTATPVPSTTEDASSSSTTLLPSTTEDSGVTSSSTTTLVPSTTEDIPSSSTTILPSTTEDSGVTSSSTTTPVPSTTEEPGVSSTTTEDSGVTSSSSTTTENSGTSSSTTSAPSTTTEDSGVPSSSSTTVSPPVETSTTQASTTTESDITSTSPSSSTSESPELTSTTTSSYPPSSVSTTTTSPEITSTISTTSSTPSPTSSTPDEDVSHNPPSTPQPSTSSLATSEQVSTPTSPITEESVSASANPNSSGIMLAILTFSILYFQMH